MGGAAPRLARARVRVRVRVRARVRDGSGSVNVCAYAYIADKKFAEKTWRNELAMVRAAKRSRKGKEDVKDG